jgi:uncharacterized protein (TIGR01777 family)
MNYLITGASGFIGKHLVKLLLARGDTVNYFGRRRSAELDSRAAFFPWNIAEGPRLDCMGQLDAVIHLTGEPIAQRWNAEVKRRLYSSRVESTRNLVSAIGKLRVKPSILISGSGAGYYGERGDEVLTEDSGPGKGFISDLCINWEKEALRATEFGVRVVPIRISIVLGPGGGALEQMAAPFRFGLGGKLGNGRQWMPWIDIHDLARLMIHAANETSLRGPVNGCSPNPVTNAEFTRDLASTLHRPALFTVPKFALTVAMGEVATHILESMRVIPKAAQQSGFQFDFPTLREALASSLKH